MTDKNEGPSFLRPSRVLERVMIDGVVVSLAILLFVTELTIWLVSPANFAGTLPIAAIVYCVVYGVRFSQISSEEARKLQAFAEQPLLKVEQANIVDDPP